MKKFLCLAAVLSLSLVGCSAATETKVGNATESMKEAAADVGSAVQGVAEDASKAAAEGAKDVVEATKDAAAGVTETAKEVTKPE
jgi:uncharacterized protein YcfL